MLASLREDFFDDACPPTLTPFRIADKWGALERDGMVVRTEHPGVPKHPPLPPTTTPPALTDLGRTVLEPIAACREWATQHLDRVRTAREAYEER